MKIRFCAYALAALALTALAAPALAQVCALEPPIGEREAEVVYVPNRADSTISVVDVTPGSACEFEVVQLITIDSNSAPTSVFISPDGREAYVVQSSRDNVGVIDTRLGVEVDRIPIEPFNGSLAGAMSPDGSRLYVSNLLQGSISVVDTVNRVQLPTIGLDIGSYPIGLRVTPDGTQLWATQEFPGAVVIIDIAGDANTIEQTIYLDPILDPLFTPFVPPAAIDIAFDTSGPTTIANVIALGREDAIAPSGLIVSIPDVLYRIPLDHDVATDPAPTPIVVGDYNNPFGPGAAEVIVTPAGTTWITNAGNLDSATNIPIPDASGDYTDYVSIVAAGSSSPVALASGFDNNPSGPADNLSPVGLARSQTGSVAGDQVYAVNFTSNTLAVFDADSETLLAVTEVGNDPVTPYQRRIPALPTEPEITLSGGASCGQTFNLSLGDTLSFNVTASTTAAFEDEDNLTLSATGLPDPGVMSPLLPISGEDSISSSFSWQPLATSDVGSYVATFEAEGDFASTQCQVTINVTLAAPPVFGTPTLGETFQVTTGQELSFDVTVSTGFVSGTVILDLLAGSSLPGAATMTPELPVADGTTSATSTFYWLPEVGDEGIYTVTWTATDGFGQVTEHYVTIEVIEPSGEVPCEPCLVTKLKVDKRPRKGTFDYRGIFGLGDASDGIDPLTEDVTITLDGFALTIPAGSFSKHGHYEYRFDGVIDGVRLTARLKAPRRHGKFFFPFRQGLWTFTFRGKGADLSSVDRPVETSTRIGDDICARTVWWLARIKD